MAPLLTLYNAIFLLQIIAGVVTTLVNSIALFAVFRFIVGFILTGVMLTQYVYFMELVGPSKRTAAGNLEFLFFNGFQPLFVIIAYFIRDWRMLTLAATLPGALLFPFWK